MEKSKIMISDVVDALNLKIEYGKEFLNREIEGGYASDMLSDVMAHGKKGDIWITLQGHPNIVAVAKLKEIAGIILVNNRKPEKETIKKAESEKLPILVSNLTAFELTGKLYQLGVSGIREC